MTCDTIPARLFDQAKKQGASPAYFVRKNGAWVPTAWSVFGDEVRQAARALISLGMEPNGTVCILGFNRPEWVIMDVACMAAGGAPAGIYTTCSPQEVQYILDHAESSVVLLEDQDQWEKVNAERERLPKLKHVVMMKGAPSIDDDLVMSWEEFMAKADETEDSALQDRLDNLEEEQMATLIYTSGTTGPPKAVMLTHKNLSWTASCALDLVKNSPDDRSLSYLPLSHIAEQMFTIHGPISVGSSVYYAESIDKVADNLKEVQPNVVFAVPRIWEKFYAAVSTKLGAATGAKAKLVAWARSVGSKVSELKNRGGQPTGLLAIQYALASKLIFSKLKPALGLGDARVCVSGAAPIGPEILDFFASLDIIIHEVYGQSEDCGPTTFNIPGRTRFGTVGPSLPEVNVKIGEDGEILVKGPNVFKGYYKDQAATDAALVDGWLHSGDLGSFDDEGFLSITGRKKEIIITAGGKNIAPKNIEASLKNHELVSQAVVIGDRRKYLSALITLEEDAAARYSEAHGVAVEDLHANEGVVSEIQKAVDATNALFARVEHVRKFTVLPRNFSIEDGELTPTLKIKRNKVNENFATEIEAMYADA